MRYSGRFFLAAALGSTIALGGCGSDSDDDPVVYSAGASPSLGLITNAAVNFYKADGSTLIGTGDTGTTGVVNGLSTSYAGPVLIEVVGDDVDAMYFDESSLTMVAFPSGNSLHALAPSSSGRFAVTPLTELAYQGALANGLFPISSQAVNALNEEVRSQFVPYVSDILTPPTPFDASTTGGDLGDDDAGRYALFLAALAELGSGQGAPALAVLNALVADLADGDIDGDDDGNSVTTPYTPGSFASDLATEIASFASSYGNSALQTSASGFSSSTTLDFGGISNPSTGGGGGSGCDTACLSFFASKAGTYDGVPDESVEKGALANEFSGASYEVVISSDGNITVSGENTDFTFTPAEITMFESSFETNVLYADTESGYNVILQEDGAAFFINISEPFVQGGGTDLDNATLDLDDGSGPAGPAPLIAMAGSYTAKVVSVTGSEFTQSAGDDVSISIDGSTGLVSIGSSAYVIDPSSLNFSLSDLSSRQLYQNPQVEVGDQDGGGDPVVLQIYNRGGTTPVAWTLKVGDPQSTLYMEQRPLITDHQNFINALSAELPVQVTSVVNDGSYNSGFDSLCSSWRISLQGSGAADDVYTLVREEDIGGGNWIVVGSDEYQPGNSIYENNAGDTSLTFENSIRITLRGDGEIDYDAFFIGNVRDQTTTDQSEIIGACS